MRRLAGFLSGLLLLAPWIGSAEDSAFPVRLDGGRPYGFHIGDVIRLQARIAVPPGYRLDEDSLPKPGARLRWLELRSVRPLPESSEGTVQMELEYQTFYAPLTVKAMTVPGFSVRLRGPGGEARADVPVWTFSTVPLHELSVFPEGGLEPLRPEAWPPLPESFGPLVRAALYGAAALLLAGYAAYLKGVSLPVRRGVHFRRAAAVIRRLSRQGGDPARLREGYAVLHRAFNQTLGEPLFLEGLERFFEGHGGYRALRSDIEAFFRASYGQFFEDDEAGDFGFDRLQALCRACIAAERNPS